MRDTVGFKHIDLHVIPFETQYYYIKTIFSPSRLDCLLTTRRRDYCAFIL